MTMRDMGGHPRCLPRAAAAFMPAVTRSLMSDDSNSATAPMMVNMARPMGLSISAKGAVQSSCWPTIAISFGRASVLRCPGVTSFLAADIGRKPGKRKAKKA